LSGVSSIDNDQFALLHGQERLNIGNPKARCPVFLLHHDPMNIPIGQQCQEFGALIVETTATCFDDFADRPAARITPRDEPLGLRVELLFVLSRRHTGVDRNELRQRRALRCLIDRLLDDHGASG
jgi:hypothetical protein